MRPFLVGSLGVCLLLSVAWYNGYPTVFSDSGAYLWTGAFFTALWPFRAPGYSVFTRFASLGASAWFVVAMQAVIVVYVLHAVCDYLMSGDRKLSDQCFLVSLCLLTGLTSLPWLVSLVMPDVFAGVLFLSMFLLAFDANSRPLRRMCLAVCLTISVGAHASFFPIAGVFATVVVASRHLGLRQYATPPARAVFARLLVPLMVAGLCTAAVNRKMGLGFRISPHGSAFLLARLFGDGLAADYLRENCPKRPLISCRYLSNLPRSQEEFMFQHPLVRDLIGREDESNEIVRGTILAYPLRFATSSIKESLRQFIAVRTGDEIRSYGAREWNNSVLQRVFPGEFLNFSSDKQMCGRLLPLADAAAAVHTVIFWLSLVACLAIAWTAGFGRINEFFYSAVAFLVINASISASFAGVFNRYQGRVAWVIPFCLTAYGYCFAKKSQLVLMDGSGGNNATRARRTATPIVATESRAVLANRENTSSIGTRIRSPKPGFGQTKTKQTAEISESSFCIGEFNRIRQKIRRENEWSS